MSLSAFSGGHQIRRPVVVTQTPIGPTDNLQAAIDAAPSGATLALTAGATYTGNFVIWKPLTLTTQGTIPTGRATPYGNLGKLKAPSGGAPALLIAADNVNIVGVEGLFNPGGFGQIFQLGDSEVTSVSLMPNYVVIDRCYIHGDPTEGQKNGIQLNSRNTQITQCYIWDIKRAGQDAVGISGGLGPGPYLIHDNYISASGHCVLFGGVDPRVTNLIPTDITVTYNDMIKPDIWGVESWNIKNVFELKSAQNVLIEHNYFSGSWINAQSGYGVMFTVRNQDGGAPWNTIQDVIFRHNVIDRCAAGIQILGLDDTPGHASVLMSNLLIEDNDITLVDWWGNGRAILIAGAPDALQIVGNTTHQTTHSFITFVQPHPLTNFVFTGNDVAEGFWGIFGDDAPGLGGAALDYYAAPYTWSGNTVRRVGDSGNNGTVTYPSGTTIAAPDATMLRVSVTQGALVNSVGTIVRPRGVDTEGVANFSLFYTGGMPAYIDRLTATDADGQVWHTKIVRLIFERYPCANPGRLYQAGDVRIPLCVPDTAQFPPWPANAQVVEGSVYTFGGQRYAASARTWRGDKGAYWNNQDNDKWVVGDVVRSIWTPEEGDVSAHRVYICTSQQTSTEINPPGSAPHGTGTGVVCALGATWSYLGEWGMTGASEPFSGTRKFDGYHGGAQYFDGWIDNLTSWQPVGPDYTPEEAETLWADWTEDVLNPTVQRCVDNGIYCFICDFDFGPAHLPLRNARMMDFWDRVAQGPWKNHPRVMFNLWNESEDVGGFSGWDWSLQKWSIQQCVDMIRGHGAHNVILCTTPAYCAYTYQATASPITGMEVMYDNHLYSDYYIGTGNETNLSTALATNLPVFCGEFGVNQPDDVTTVDTFFADFMARIETAYGSSHPAAGWGAWAFSQYWAPVFFTDGLYTVTNYYGRKVRGKLLEFT